MTAETAIAEIRQLYALSLPNDDLVDAIAEILNKVTSVRQGAEE